MHGDLDCEISVRDLIEGLCQQVGQAQWDLAGHGRLIPKPRHVGPPWSKQNDSLAWGVLQLLHHFAKYGCWWEGVCVQILHGTQSEPTAVARGSGNRGNLLLKLVANRSIFGKCHLLHSLEDLWKERPLCLDGLA